MTRSSDVAGYVRDLVHLIREDAAEARRDKAARPPSERLYFEGREAALTEVLLAMQSQADAFLIRREELGLDGFDPLGDTLDPNL